jgi:coenzyme F420-reducing hydrogenase alpha subunit
MATTINNSAHDPKLNKNARKMLDKLKKAKDKAVEAANTQAGLGDAYKGVKRKKKSSKLTKAQKRFSNSTINARRAAYKKAEAKRIEAERIKAYQKTKTPDADSLPPAR